MTLLFSSLNEHPISGVDVSDRGLSYGDGHFTTAKITHGKVEHFELHLARLKHSHETLGLDRLASLNIEALRNYLCQLAESYHNVVLKVVITAGIGGRGYSRVGAKELSRFVTISELPPHYDTWQVDGIRIDVSNFQLSSQPVLAGIKHLNRLEQVLIRAELDQKDTDDMLVCDQRGHIIEASCANVFWYKQQQWFTPDLSTSGVNGVFRQYVLANIEGIQISEYAMTELNNVEAMFICNSIMDIVPISNFQGKDLTLEPVRQLQKRLK